MRVFDTKKRNDLYVFNFYRSIKIVGGKEVIQTGNFETQISHKPDTYFKR